MYDLEHMDKRLIIYVNIFLMSNRLQTIMDRILDEVTAKQWLLLILMGVFEKPPTLNELATLLDSSHQNTKQIVSKLEQKGFIEVTKDDKDKRALRIVMTDKVNDLWGKYDTVCDTFMDDLFQDLSPKQIEEFCKTQWILYDRLHEMQTKLENND